jgi:hypothetical protein
MKKKKKSEIMKELYEGKRARLHSVHVIWGIKFN